MRITVKCIIKWGLIAEILTAIVGQVGEFTLRYRAYSSAFDELFGHYRLQGEGLTEEFELNPNSVTVNNRSAAIQLDPNYQHYDHRSGRNLPHSATNDISQNDIEKDEVPEPAALQKNETERLTLADIMSTIFRTSFVITNNTQPEAPPPLLNFESYSNPMPDMLNLPKSLDPRPLMVCTVLVCLNLLFIVGIVIEYLPIICPLTIVWLLYLILVLLILHAGSTASNPTSSPTIISQSPWTTLTPSPFTILVVSIILVFSLIMIAIIVEERRQIAMRIRAKSAAIPLVKSRDMDLDLDEI